MMYMRAFRSTLLTLALLAPLPAAAVQPSEQLADPKLEQRARELSTHLRCMVCQNQSIDDSDAPLAKDLRVLVRERLKSEVDTLRREIAVLMQAAVNVGTEAMSESQEEVVFSGERNLLAVSDFSGDMGHLRRAFDLLLAQPDIDPTRVALVGHDFGAMYGLIAAAQDQRVRTCVLMACVPRLIDWFLGLWR